MLTLEAPAKINLALHVTGQRADGYHLIESLVVFTDLGDLVSVELSDRDGFILEGPESGALTAEDTQSNLVVRARDSLRAAAHRSGMEAAPVQIRLDKRLPVASGIGGGSADAAATLKALCRIWNFAPEPETLSTIALGLGADVPMCLSGQPLIARGIGEALDPVKLGFALDLVIVNPRIGISTPAVFSKLQRRDNTPLPAPEGLTDKHRFVEWLSQTRNDLQSPAMQLVPDIADCLSAVRDSGAQFVRMSGSGASCFGLYQSTEAAQDAAQRLRDEQPSWFIQATQTLSQG
ncbi:4-diphosphocytidyl-2-C-methyl-D-erythritol kinase [Hoeflea sp. IMCC20628]|uniref:4-(cytidine 5'-diphospho)-2-C-methyl-D-erythritol kinase n=1 Tax=Hoeflea sp. IMCC20628 TaxID=1620421 RepID=UPI00063AB91D|nr:4-(cytidine 5'-diphospho)-2-C-methyl-D-erythritol kinase [Hoeflea sp. IMCC20628]AKI01539.1 4-diphosphocytidyl-2-C-methyl-D-erythritol kinase [Hoeflea sp. IMCC20628]